MGSNKASMIKNRFGGSEKKYLEYMRSIGRKAGKASAKSEKHYKFTSEKGLAAYKARMIKESKGEIK